MEYTSYERVKAALEHREPDRVPFDLGSSGVTGINIKCLNNLRNYLGLKKKGLKLFDVVSQTAIVDDDLIEKLKIDVKSAPPKSPIKKNILEKKVWSEAEHYKLIDELGIGWKMPIEGGHFFDLYKNPLKDAETVEDIENYPWPDALDPERYTDLKKRADHIVYKEKKAYMLGRHFAGMWETAMWMTGYEKFFMDMYFNKKLIHAIMNKMTELKMLYWEKALETVGKNVLVVSTADDLGTQKSLLVSPESYKELIWPYHKKLFQFIKKKAKSKAYIFYHCDGAIKEAIPLLLEAGIDILNPVQVQCKGMDTKMLKKEFGKDLIFWGALADSQSILPFGTPEEVREETKRRIDDLAPGGGWIAAPIHNIQSEVPPENIMVMWKTLQEHGVY
jgi:uroporphyrinogen decarboxylase